MRNLIISALDTAMIRACESIPATKRIYKSISIIDVKPAELMEFMMTNNIPDHAWFSGPNNGYDDVWDDIQLTWDVYVPTSEKDDIQHTKRMFNNISFKYVYQSLTQNGYRRIGCDTLCLRKFKDTTAYDMYMESDYDRLVDYYCLYFTNDQ